MVSRKEIKNKKSLDDKLNSRVGRVFKLKPVKSNLKDEELLSKCS